MPSSIDPCILNINHMFITLSTLTDGVPELLAQADSHQVLTELIGSQSDITHPLGLLPRGVRYISGDSCTFCIEYPPQEAKVLLPKWAREKRGKRIVKLWFPKHFICVRFDLEFKGIIALALAVSYNHNYMLSDPIQTVPGYNTFEFPIIPTPELRSTYATIGDFLATLHERVFSVGLSITDSNSFSPVVCGPAQLPSKIDPASYWQWWADQGDHVLEWSFNEPVTSTLGDILFVPDAESSTTSKETYPATLNRIITAIKKHDQLERIKRVNHERAARQARMYEGIGIESTRPDPYITSPTWTAGTTVGSFTTGSNRESGIHIEWAAPTRVEFTELVAPTPPENEDIPNDGDLEDEYNPDLALNVDVRQAVRNVTTAAQDVAAINEALNRATAAIDESVREQRQRWIEENDVLDTDTSEDI